MEQDLRQIAYYGSLAPSGHNTQPWKFRIKHNQIILLPDFSRSLPVVDPDDHALFISLGCAVENMVIAAGKNGYATEVEIKELPEPAIYLNFSKGAVCDEALFEQITIRQSTRNTYDSRPVPQEDLVQLKQAAAREGIDCRIFSGTEEMEALIPFVKDGCMRQFRNHDFVKELIHWIRFNRSAAEGSGDGLFGAATGNPSVPEWFGKLFMELTASPSRQAEKVAGEIISSAALVLFIAERNDMQSWINTGRSFERFALMASALGIHLAHENMPCEEMEVRKLLAAHLGLRNEEQPLLLVRIGYSQKMPYAYRRPLEEMLIEEELSATI